MTSTTSEVDLEVAVRPGDDLDHRKHREVANGLMRAKHAKYLARVLKLMPASAAGFDTSR